MEETVISNRHKIGINCLLTGYFMYLVSFFLFNGDFFWEENSTLFVITDLIGLAVQLVGAVASIHFRYRRDRHNKINNFAFWLYISHVVVILTYFAVVCALLYFGVLDVC